MSSSIMFTTFDWKERADAQKFVQKMRRKGMAVYIAETGTDAYDLITLDYRDPAQLAWWEDWIPNMLRQTIRPVDERLDECGRVTPSAGPCLPPVRTRKR